MLLNTFATFHLLIKKQRIFVELLNYTMNEKLDILIELSMQILTYALSHICCKIQIISFCALCNYKLLYKLSRVVQTNSMTVHSHLSCKPIR